MLPITALRSAALFGGSGVGLGAFAAHAMKAHFDPQALHTFETGVRYQLAHALAMLACATLGYLGVGTRVASTCFATGILLFSGSLYALVWTGWSWLGAVTPLGGVALLAGWVLLALARAPRRHPTALSAASGD